MMMRSTLLLRTLVLALVLVVGLAQPAGADVTAFLGLSPTPHNRGARGFSGGLSLIILGFEVEYSEILEDTTEALPSLKTWSGNVLLQTPADVQGVQLYATAGGSGYRERLGEDHVTNVGVNVGGGAKIRIKGPLRVRLDYRVFTLHGEPRHTTYQRFYAGANIAF